jgi:lipoprotein-anchoring transpeptidase ErfK/SrfK
MLPRRVRVGPPAGGSVRGDLLVTLRLDRMRRIVALAVTALILAAGLVTRSAAPAGAAENGYWLFALDGGVFSFGAARFHGSMGGTTLNAPVVSLAPSPTGEGYWLVATDGGVFAFGDSRFQGSLGAVALNAPVVGIVPTRSGNGYWMVATDGGVFAFGDASFVGSLGADPPDFPVVGFAPTPSGHGYWMLGADGAIYPFGDAGDFGDAVGSTVPIVSLAPTASGQGYWIASTDGVIRSFGDAPVLGVTRPAEGGNPDAPLVGLVPTASGQGLWATRSDGAVTTYGDAPHLGDMAGSGLNGAILGLSTTTAASTGGAALSLLYGNAYPGFEANPVTMVARMKVGRADLYASPTTTERVGALTSPNLAGQTTTLRVATIVGDKALVYLPQRPNESRAWIWLGDVQLSQSPYKILVDTGAHTVSLFLRGQEIFTTIAGVGKASTPTPLGQYFVSDTWQLSSPGGPYGPYALGLSAYSEVLEQFGGGPGQTAIHGTNQPGLLGGNPSAGCIRVSNAAITYLIGLVPLGTPVEMV